MGISLFDVCVQYKKWSTPMIAFGPFDKPEDAVRCLIVLAGREDLLTATIVQHVKSGEASRGK